jgi:hypothetical protein
MSPMSSGALTLSDFPGTALEVHCPRCDRRGRYAKTRLVERIGFDMRLPDLLRQLSPDCPARGELKKQASGAIYPVSRAIAER